VQFLDEEGSAVFQLEEGGEVGRGCLVDAVVGADSTVADAAVAFILEEGRDRMKKALSIEDDPFSRAEPLPVAEGCGEQSFAAFEELVAVPAELGIGSGKDQQSPTPVDKFSEELETAFIEPRGAEKNGHADVAEMTFVELVVAHAARRHEIDALKTGGAIGLESELEKVDGGETRLTAVALEKQHLEMGPDGNDEMTDVVGGEGVGGANPDLEGVVAFFFKLGFKDDLGGFACATAAVRLVEEGTTLATKLDAKVVGESALRRPAHVDQETKRLPGGDDGNRRLDRDESKISAA